MPIRPVPVGDRLFQHRDQPGVEKRNTRQVIAAGTRIRASSATRSRSSGYISLGEFPDRVIRPPDALRPLLAATASALNARGRVCRRVLALILRRRNLIPASQMSTKPIAIPKATSAASNRKLSTAQQRHLMEVHRAGMHSTAGLAELFNVARSTVYRTVQRSVAN